MNGAFPGGPVVRNPPCNAGIYVQSLVKELRNHMCTTASVVSTLCNTIHHSSPGSSVHGDSPGKNTGVDCHFLLRGNLPDLGIDPRTLTRILKWFAIPFSSGPHLVRTLHHGLSILVAPHGMA